MTPRPTATTPSTSGTGWWRCGDGTCQAGEVGLTSVDAAGRAWAAHWWAVHRPPPRYPRGSSTPRVGAQQRGRDVFLAERDAMHHRKATPDDDGGEMIDPGVPRGF